MKYFCMFFRQIDVFTKQKLRFDEFFIRISQFAKSHKIHVDLFINKTSGTRNTTKIAKKFLKTTINRQVT